jgi:hypothetical protein
MNSSLGPLRGGFLFQCHSEKDMTQGFACLVRSIQTVWLTPDDAERGVRLGRPATTVARPSRAHLDTRTAFTQNDTGARQRENLCLALRDVYS